MDVADMATKILAANPNPSSYEHAIALSILLRDNCITAAGITEHGHQHLIDAIQDHYPDLEGIPQR